MSEPAVCPACAGREDIWCRRCRCSRVLCVPVTLKHDGLLGSLQKTDYMRYYHTYLPAHLLDDIREAVEVARDTAMTHFPVGARSLDHDAYNEMYVHVMRVLGHEEWGKELVPWVLIGRESLRILDGHVAIDTRGQLVRGSD